jgi:hypothetical protein
MTHVPAAPAKSSRIAACRLWHSWRDDLDLKTAAAHIVSGMIPVATPRLDARGAARL